MAAKIHRLPTAAQQAQAEAARQMRSAMGEMAMPDQLRGDLLAFLEQSGAEPGAEWTFVQLHAQRHTQVVEWIHREAPRPINVLRLWTLMFSHLRRDTGEVMRSREQLAAALGMPLREISRAISTLERAGAIYRRRSRVPGMKGPGTVRYFVSALIVTCASGEIRAKLQREAPPLRLASPD